MYKNLQTSTIKIWNEEIVSRKREIKKDEAITFGPVEHLSF